MCQGFSGTFIIRMNEMPARKLGTSFGRGFFSTVLKFVESIKLPDSERKNSLRIVPILQRRVWSVGWRRRAMVQNPSSSQIGVTLLPEMSPLDPLGPCTALTLLPLLPPTHSVFWCRHCWACDCILCFFPAIVT